LLVLTVQCSGLSTTHVFFEPLDFIAKLAVLVPKPSVNLTRFHGVFVPNSKKRVDVTLAKRGKGRPRLGNEDKTAVLICPKCGGDAKVIACIEDQAVIDKILQHLQAKGVLPRYRQNCCR
jgi:hypothetical protein